MILAFLLLGPILALGLAAYALARKAAQNAQDAQRMALIASNLEGQLKQSEARGEQLADIAKHAIDEAAKVAGLKADEVWSPPPESVVPQSVYVSPVVASCLRCGVSVRHLPFMFPVHCPGCKNLIDPILDDPPEL